MQLGNLKYLILLPCYNKAAGTVNFASQQNFVVKELMMQGRSAVEKCKVLCHANYFLFICSQTGKLDVKKNLPWDNTCIKHQPLKYQCGHKFTCMWVHVSCSLFCLWVQCIMMKLPCVTQSGKEAWEWVMHFSLLKNDPCCSLIDIISLYVDGQIWCLIHSANAESLMSDTFN